MIVTQSGRLILAVAAGLLYFSGLPPLNWWPGGWLAVVPLVLATHGARLRHVVGLGMVAGWTYAFTTGFWVYESAHGQFGLSPAHAAAFLSIVVGFGCGFGVMIAALLGEWLARGPRPMPRIVSWPVGWMLGECVRFVGGAAMPWCFLAVTQSSVPLHLQVVALGGLLLLSGILVAFGVCLAEVVHAWLDLRILRLRWLAGAAAIYGVVVLYGSWRFEHGGQSAPSENSVRVAIVQGNIPQALRWEREQQPRHWKIHEVLTYLAREAEPDITAWSETAWGTRRSDSAHFAQPLRRLAGEQAMFVGFSELVAAKPDAKLKHNSLVSVAREGDVSLYRKRRPVPFGEYTPAGLDLLQKQRQFPLDVSPGPRVPSLLQPEGLPPAGAMICYEFLFPQVLRDTVNAGGEWLFIASNDGWYDTTYALEQHHAQVALAAVATGRDIVRATNSGISGGFDAWGRPLSFIKGALVDEDAHERALLGGGPPRLPTTPLAEGATQLPPLRAGWGVLEIQPRTEQTLYARYGNWIIWPCLALVGLKAFVLTRVKYRCS